MVRILPRLAVALLMIALPLASVAGASEVVTDPEPCERYAHELIAEFGQHVKAMAARAQAFEERLAQERAAWSQEAHSPEDAQAFAERHEHERHAFYHQLWMAYQDAHHAMKQHYVARCGDYAAEAFRTWQPPAPPVPAKYRPAEVVVVDPAPPKEPTTTWEGCATWSYGAPAEPAGATEPAPTGTGGSGAEPATAPEAQGGAATAETTPTGEAVEQHSSPSYDCPPPEAWQACQAIGAELSTTLQAAAEAVAADQRAFAARQAQEREAFAADEHTDAELQAFAERQAREAWERAQGWERQLAAAHEEMMRTVQMHCSAVMAAPSSGAMAERPGCGDEVRAYERDRIAFEERQRGLRSEFEGTWRTQWAEMAAQEPGEDAWMAFKERAAKARIAFEEQARGSYAAWAREHPPPMPCTPTPIVITHEGCDAERTRLEAGAYEQHLRERYLGAKEDWASFQAGIDARLAAFHDLWAQRRAGLAEDQASAEARAQLEKDYAAAKEALHATIEAERMAWEQRWRAEGEAVESKLRAAMEDFARSQLERCWTKPALLPAPQGPLPVAGAVAVRGDPEHERLQCMLDVRVAMEQFASQQLRDLRDFWAVAPDDATAQRFDEAQREARKAFEARVQLQRAECEKALRVAHVAMVETAQADAAPVEKMGSFRVEPDEAAGIVEVRGSHVSFTGDMATEDLYGYRVDGQLFFDAIRKDAPFRDFGAQDGPRGTVMELRGEGFAYTFHDNPTGLAAFQGTIELDVADYLQAKPVPGGIELAGGDRRGVLRGDVALQEGVVLVTGSARFLVPDTAQPALDKVSNKHRPDIAQAIAAKRVGAEVTVVQDQDGLASEPLVFDDMTIRVERARPGSVSVRIDKPDHEGRTIVLNVDKRLLSDLAQVGVEVWDVEGGSESEAGAARATSLADVLDPTDDDGIEYWVVTDLDGVQVLVSFTHFSEKRVEVRSMAEGFESLGVPGFEAVLAFAGLGAALAVRRRR